MIIDDRADAIFFPTIEGILQQFGGTVVSCDEHYEDAVDGLI